MLTKKIPNHVDENIFVFHCICASRSHLLRNPHHRHHINIYLNHFPLQHLLRHVLENQHKLHKFLQLLQQQSVRHCSSGRLQQAVQPEIEQDYPQVKTIDASNSYYPVNQPFKHEPDVGDQFAVSQWKTFTLHLLSDIESLECNTTLITIETKCGVK